MKRKKSRKEKEMYGEERRRKKDKLKYRKKTGEKYGKKWGGGGISGKKLEKINFEGI